MKNVTKEVSQTVCWTILIQRDFTGSRIKFHIAFVGKLYCVCEITENNRIYKVGLSNAIKFVRVRTINESLNGGIISKFPYSFSKIFTCNITIVQFCDNLILFQILFHIYLYMLIYGKQVKKYQSVLRTNVCIPSANVRLFMYIYFNTFKYILSYWANIAHFISDPNLICIIQITDLENFDNFLHVIILRKMLKCT